MPYYYLCFIRKEKEMEKKYIQNISDEEIFSPDKVRKIKRLSREYLKNTTYPSKNHQYAVADIDCGIVKLFVYKCIDNKAIIDFIHVNDMNKMYTRYFVTESRDKERVTSNGFRREMFCINMDIDDINIILEWLDKEDEYYDYLKRNCYYLLEEVPQTILRKKKEAKKQKEYDKNKKLFSSLQNIPKGWQEWLDKVAVPEDYAIFSRKEKQVFFTCCQETVAEGDLPKFKEKQLVVCPTCGKKTIALSENRRMPYINRTACLFNKLADGTIVTRYFDVRYYFGKKPTKKYYSEVVRMVWSGNLHYDYYESLGDGNWKEYIPSYSYWGNIRHYTFRDESAVYTRNVNRVLKGTRFENCGYKELKKYYNDEKHYGYFLENYLREYLGSPFIEQLVKAGIKEEVRLGFRNISYSANRSKTKPNEILGISKQYLKEFQNKPYVEHLLKVYQQASSRGISNLQRKKAILIAKHFTYDIENVLDMPFERLLKTKEYIEEQALNSNYVDTRYYFDYISLVKRLGFSMKGNRFPADLVDAHDKMNELYNLKKEEIKMKEFERRAKELKDFAFETKNFIFVIPQTPDDFVKESAVLHHCVANCYTSKYADGDTNIIFIREKSDITKPFVTMEFFNDKVIQVRGVNNSTPEEKVLKAVEIFKQQKLAVA